MRPVLGGIAADMQKVSRRASEKFKLKIEYKPPFDCAKCF